MRVVKLNEILDTFPQICEVTESCGGVVQNYCRACGKWGCDGCFDGLCGECRFCAPVDMVAYQEAVDEYRGLQGAARQSERANRAVGTEGSPVGADCAGKTWKHIQGGAR